jgi:predicted RNA-binding protein Jag
MTLKGEAGVTTSSRGRGELKKVIVSTRPGGVPPQP